MAQPPDTSKIYTAVDVWRELALLRGLSVLGSQARSWDVDNVRSLRSAVTGDPLPVTEKFEERLHQQLAGQKPEVICLAAEMLWVLFLFPRTGITPRRKRELIATVWGWSGAEIEPHILLADEVLTGIGDAGRAFNTHRDLEFEALVDVVIALKETGSSIASISPREFGLLIDRVPKARGRKIRNILLHLCFPDHYERIASNTHKREIVRAFADLLPNGEQPKTKPLIEVDDQLLVIRGKLQERAPDKQIDFYDPDLQAIWNPPADPEDAGVARRSTKKARTKSAANKATAGQGDEIDVMSMLKREATQRAAATDPMPQQQQPPRQQEAIQQQEVVRQQEIVQQKSAVDEEVPLSAETANAHARAGVALAHHLAHRAKRPQPTPDLLFASFIALSARSDYRSHAAEALRGQMRQALIAQGKQTEPERVLLERYGIEPKFEPLEVDHVWPGPVLAPILDAADEVRTRVGRPRPQALSPRHIFTVLLLPGPHTVAPFLAELGFSTADLRATLLQSIEARRLGEDRDEWRRILTIDELTPDVAFYAGFSTDALRTDDSAAAITKKDDRLNVMRDVTALAEVLAAQDTKPPLAVGLFGDWGTGKSFFMELMRQEIDLLGQENPDFYCERVVQVWFNAWHYMEANLWASLAARVFEELAEQLEKWELPKDQRAELFERLQQSQGVLAEAVSERNEANARIEAIRTEREHKERSITATAATAFRAATAALSADPEVQQKLRYAKDRLGLTAAQADVATAGEQVRQLRSLGGRITAIGRTLLKRPLFLGLGILIFAAVWFGARWLLDRVGVLEGASGIVRAVAAWLPAMLAAITPVAVWVSRGVRWLDDVATRLQQQRDSEQRQEELALQRDLMRLEERQREAQARVDALNREIDDLRAGRRLQRFILERHTSAEYRQHLGLVNLIRNDFERLSKLLLESQQEDAGDSKAAAVANVANQPPTPANAPGDGDQPDEPAQGDGAATGEVQVPAPLPRIDRIILYIDDLDRCPEDRVVQVLQAVHLLLAFPLFVVVVGVDSRWLVLSLEDHYAALRGTTKRDDAKPNGKKSEEWNTTPQNYLEKIFQIPFSLRPMEPGGFSELVSALLPIGDQDEEAATKATTPATVTAGEESEPEASAESEDDTDVSADEGVDAAEVEEEEGDEDVADEEIVQEASDADHEAATRHEMPIPGRPNPQGLTVGKTERELIQKLHPLIASPRALKRFTNVYRFIRVQQRGARLDRFRGTDGRPGEFEVVALLLGAVVGYPIEAANLLRAVLANRDKEWWTIVEELGDEGAAEDAKARAEAAAGTAARTNERERATLREALLEVRDAAKIGPHTPRVFSDWTREVARFSFQSGRILSIRAPEDDDEAAENVA